MSARLLVTGTGTGVGGRHRLRPRPGFEAPVSPPIAAQGAVRARSRRATSRCRDAAASLRAQFPPAGREHSVFVVDPLGKLMMSYDGCTGPRGLLLDCRSCCGCPIRGLAEIACGCFGGQPQAKGVTFARCSVPNWMLCDLNAC